MCSGGRSFNCLCLLVSTTGMDLVPRVQLRDWVESDQAGATNRHQGVHRAHARRRRDDMFGSEENRQYPFDSLDEVTRLATSVMGRTYKDQSSTHIYKGARLSSCSDAICGETKVLQEIQGSLERVNDGGFTNTAPKLANFEECSVRFNAFNETVSKQRAGHRILDISQS